MRIFPDTNVWVSAFATRGLCADLLRRLLRHHNHRWELLSAPPVREETLRILAVKFGADDEELALVRRVMAIAVEVTMPVDERISALSIPDPDDVPIIAAALAGRADWFVTGDKALLELEHVERLPIVSPRAAWEKMTPSGR